MELDGDGIVRRFQFEFDDGRKLMISAYGGQTPIGIGIYLLNKSRKSFTLDRDATRAELQQAKSELNALLDEFIAKGERP